MTTKNGPVLIELGVAQAANPARAPDLPDIAPLPSGSAMQSLATLASRRPSVPWRLFRATFLGLVGIVISLVVWDFTASLLARNLWLGRIVLGVGTVCLLAALALIVRELRALGHLRRIDGLKKACKSALGSADLGEARAFADRLERFYIGRKDMGWALENLTSRRRDVFDADSMMALVEQELMTPLDAMAMREIEASARQVAVVTAFVPLALADVVAALIANLSMVRRIAEVYGGRAGVFGSWRLMRTVLLHLIATGAVSVGDDLIHSVAGGGLIGKLSRRFGEGVVNGALTARVGVAAMDVCRPMAFRALKRPKVSGLVARALRGVFSKA